MAKLPKPITEYRLTNHARMEIARRQISESEVARVLASPEPKEYAKVAKSIRFISRRQIMAHGPTSDA